MKVAFFEIEDWEKEYLKKQLKDAEVDFFAEKFSTENVASVQSAEIISVFTDSQIDKNVLAQLTNLRMIATRSTGFDHIDVAEARAKNIIVCNVPTYGENTVAEHTFALILDLSRKIHQSIESVKKEGFLAKGLRGFDLKGKTLGIVGMGHIGQHVARIANGFEINVLGYDLREDKKLAKNLGFKYVAFDDLLKNSDIITLHAPLNNHTKHLINAENIGLVKRGAYLINTARGGLIETEALVKALDEGILAGAGLDVLEEEQAIKEERELLTEKSIKQVNFKVIMQDHILMERDNVIVTPHNAFNSKEALERILQTTVENIQGFVRGRSSNVVA